MLSLVRIAFFCLTIIFLINTTAFANRDVDAINKTFKTCRKALLERDGGTIWEMLDNQTREYYESAINFALTIKKKDLDKLDMNTKLLVLSLRNEFKKSQLTSLKGKDIFNKWINQGQISKSLLAGIEKLYKVKLNGKLAQGYVNKDPNMPVFYFAKEGRHWKFALVESIKRASAAHEQMIKQSGLTEAEYIEFAVRTMAQVGFDKRTYDGPIN